MMLRNNIYKPGGRGRKPLYFLLMACCSVFTVYCILYSYAATAEENVLKVPIVTGSGEGVLSNEWRIKEWKGKADVRIVNDNDAGQVVRLRSEKTSTALYKEIEFNIKDYPFLNWQWKVTKIPTGGDVRKKETDDQAAQIYVIFPKFPSQINSRTLGYIWETNAPVGGEFTSTKFSKIKYVVVKQSANDLGKWFSEKRNVYDDYKRLFNEEPPMVGSVSLMIDSDDTQTSAESFFKDIYFSKE